MTTTTTTVILITTAQTILALGVIGTIVLIFALIIRELTASHTGIGEISFLDRVKYPAQKERIQTLSKNTVVVVIPLLIFTLVVIIEAADIVSA